MEPNAPGPQMQQLTVFICEQDHWQNRPLYLAILELVRAEGIAGATVVKGLAGYSATGRLIRTGGLVEVTASLPVMIAIVDERAKLGGLLPRLEEMIAGGGGLITLVDLAGHVYRHPGRRAAPARRVAQIMDREVVTVPPEMPVADLLLLLLDKPYTAVPVVDTERRVLGMVTEGDLLRKPGLGLRLNVLEELQDEQGAAFEKIVNNLRAGGNKAGEVMGVRPEAVIGPDASLEDAAKLMARLGLKRLPVVDNERRLLGMVTRLDLLRAAGAPTTQSRAQLDFPPTGARTVGDVMLTEVPVVQGDTPVEQVVEAFAGGSTRRVVVVNNPSERRVLGIITESDLVQRVSAPARPGLLQSLVEGLHVLGPSAGAPPLTLPRGEAGKASEIMTAPVLTVSPGTPIREAIIMILGRGIKALPVVEEGDRLVGMIDRKRLLQALSGIAEV